MKYCGDATPFHGVHVYTRCEMGMPGSETALEELMCPVLGDLLQEGIVAKLADDLYCGESTPQELLHNWEKVLHVLQKSDLRLAGPKTVISPSSTTVLGWIWKQGTLSASPHRISVMTSCRPRWLSWMRRPTGDQEVAGSTPAEVGNILLWRLIMKFFLRSFSPFRWFKKGSCQFLAKECAQLWLTA